MPRGRYRASFDQVSEFVRGRMVAYRDCGLSFREICQRAYWAHGTDGSSSHIIKHSAIDNSVTHHSVSARTIRRRFQQSGMPKRHPLLRLPLTGNHSRLRRPWCDKRRTWTMEWNNIVFTDESLFCLQHHDGQIRAWRHRVERLLNCCVMHRHTGPALDIMFWAGTGFRCRTPLTRTAGTLKNQRYISEVLEHVVLPYIQRLPSAIFQQDNV
ncbi:transposable element Tcb1 transposase [Trichonephila clavipes]|nr:transposable element Tcb1 transposase [Trichonephila clavipes]